MNGCCGIDTVSGAPAGGGGAADFAEFTDTLELLPANTGVAPLNLGIPNTTSGGGSHPALANTSLLESTPRWRATSAVGAGSSAQHRSNIALWLRGTIPRVGGFHYRARFGVSTFVSGFRAFIGFAAQTGAIAGVDPSTLVDMVGIAYDLGTTQWNMMHNDNAGVAVETPLGAAFNVVANDYLQLNLDAEPNATTIVFQAFNLTTDLTTGPFTISTELPTAGTFLSSHAWVNTGNVAATAAQIDIARIAVAPAI